MEAPSAKRLPLVEQMSSTAWSTARMPVDRNSHSGVRIVTAGSSTTAVGIISGWP